MKNTCGTMMSPVNNEGGFTLILALILLMLMTIIGVAAIKTSTTETMITSADEDKRTAFYAADSAIEQATAQLNQLFRQQHQADYNVNHDQNKLTWTFALHDTTQTDFKLLAQPPASSLWKDRFASGVTLSSIPDNTPLSNGYTYSVRIWNNADINPLKPIVPPAVNDAQNDTDGLIVVGVIATSPRNSRVAVEVTLNGAVNGTSPVGGSYTAQAGGGAGKNYNSSDVGAVSAGNMGAMSNAGGLR